MITATLPEWTPVCPYNLLNASDYRSLPAPHCKSQKASDACCLYTGTCEGSDDPSEATLDLSGVRLVAHRCWREGNSSSMLVFAKRYAEQMLGASFNVTGAASRDFAFGQWSFTPGKQTIADFEAALKAVSTPSPSLRRHHGRQPVADVEVAQKVRMSAAPAPTPSGGLLGPCIVGVIAVLAISVAAVVRSPKQVEEGLALLCAVEAVEESGTNP